MLRGDPQTPDEDPIITAAAARIAAWPVWKRDSMRDQIAALGRSGENVER